MSCPRRWEVRAVDEGRLSSTDVAAFERHTRTCAECREELEGLERLRSLSRELLHREPTELELRRVRGRVLRDAMSAGGRASGVRRTMAVAASVVGVAAAAAGWWTLHHARETVARTSEPPSFAASVTPRGPADWDQAREGSSERVALREGELSLQVRKQHDGERFVVAVPDGEVEVRGTTFQVGVHHGETTRVHVDTGVVVVRVHGESVLAAGESWAPAPEAAASPAVSEVPAATPLVVDRPPSAVHRSSSPPPHVSAARPPEPAVRAASEGDAEVAEYGRAVDAYRLGRFQQAADLLGAFARAHPASPLLEDATFIQAASLASAGQTHAAATVAAEHARRFPASFHRKDAAVLVARDLRDQGDCAAARQAVGPWLAAAESDSAVASALGGCLERH